MKGQLHAPAISAPEKEPSLPIVLDLKVKCFPLLNCMPQWSGRFREKSSPPISEPRFHGLPTQRMVSIYTIAAPHWVGGWVKSRAMIIVPDAATKRYRQPIAGQEAISVCILLHNLYPKFPRQSAAVPRRCSLERTRLHSVLQGPTNF